LKGLYNTLSAVG